MTKFNKADFQYSGGYLTYGPNRDFIARFKYVGSNRAGFQSFLIKNFTVEEYFSRRATETPGGILESKGYVSAVVRKILKASGYPETRAGFDAYIQAQVQKTLQRIAA